MFVAWRDLKAARGRFALIGAVVALITVLVTFLSGLTGGLVQQNISAITGLDTDRVVFAAGGTSGDDAPSYADSTVSRAQSDAWRARPGVTDVAPLGIAQSRLQAGDRQQTVTLFGGGPAAGTTTPPPGHIVLPRTAATDLGVQAGDRVSIGGRNLTVDRVGADRWYSHMPVADVDLADWRQLSGGPGAQDAAASSLGTVLLVSGQGVDWSAADAAAGTTSASVLSSLTALETFKSEVGSLLLMVVLLFGISALVVGAFFTVWSIQRRGDVAVLTALGATTRMLVLDALGQALLVLVISIGLGLGITVLAATAAGDALPFLLSPVTTVLPAVAMTVLGLAGAAVATRSVTRTDPLIALGSAR